MNKWLYITSALLILIACKKPSDRPCWKFNGEITSKEILLDDMTESIHLNDNINIVLINDSTDQIIIEGPENIIDHIDIINVSNKTIFRNKNNCKFLRNPLPITIYYHYTYLNLIELFGYGSLSNNDTIYHDLHITAFKSYSNAVLNVNNYSTKCGIVLGSTAISISGQCEHFSAYSSGIAPMNAKSLKCNHAHANSSALGNFYINSTQSLVIELRSQGNVYYSGNPAITDFHDSGQGEIIKLD